MWKPIKGYEDIYDINKSGQIKTMGRKYSDGRYYKDRILKQRLSSNGYYTITLYKHGKPKVFTIHRLLMITFVPNIKNYPCVNHKNGIRTDNRLCNLEWCSNSYNHLHSFKNNGRVTWNKGNITRRLIKCICEKMFHARRKTSISCSRKCEFIRRKSCSSILSKTK
jgi:hypothetical protein